MMGFENNLAQMIMTQATMKPICARPITQGVRGAILKKKLTQMIIIIR